MSDKNIKKSEWMKKENLTKIGFPIVAILIVIVIILNINGTIMFNKSGRLNSELKKSGKKFYTQFYYDQVTKDKKEKQIQTELENFKVIGIKVNLNSLKNYSYDVNKKSIDLLEKNGCDITKTSVTIYPKKPYGKNDFDIKTNIECK